MTTTNERLSLFRRGRTTNPDVEAVEPDTEPIPLPTDTNGTETSVPCLSCGVAVSLESGDVVETRDLELPTRRTWRQDFARCGECSQLRITASRIVEMNPSLSGRYGSVVTDRLEGALVSLSVLKLPLPDPATVNVEDVVRLLRFLSLGSVVQWIARATEAPGYSQLFPFAHLTGENRDVLRSRFADSVADRLAVNAPPINVTPPNIGQRELAYGAVPVTTGCLLCGIGELKVAASASQSVWTLRPSAISPHQLGGRRSPMKLHGYSCPACTAALDYAGAFGPSAMERAVTVALGVAGQWRDDAALNGLRGWGALFADAINRDLPAPLPNTTPWAHVGDLDQLRDMIELGVLG